MKSRGFALMTVLIIVIIVPIVVFGITFIITSSISRYDAQTRSMKALYLAEAGIHKAIFNIKSTGAPLPISNLDANNQIVVTVVAQCSNTYQLKSIGTSVAGGNSIERTVFAQVDASSNKIQIYREGDGLGIPPPVCCDQIWWPFSEGSSNVTKTSPVNLSYQGALTPGVPDPDWVAGVAGDAIRFNQTAPTNYVLVPDPGASSLLDLTTAGTVMAWVDPASIPNLSVQTIVEKGEGTPASTAYALFLARTSANRAMIRFRIYQGTTPYLVSGTNNAITVTGGWYHVAGVWDSTGLLVYLNGLPDGTLTTSNRVANDNNNHVYMGASKDAGGALTTAREFNGTIDEVHIFGCRKTDAEIKAYYNSTCAGSGAVPCPQD